MSYKVAHDLFQLYTKNRYAPKVSTQYHHHFQDLD